MLTFLDLSAALLLLSAAFSWLNYKFVPLPHAIGLLAMSVLASVLLVFMDYLFPERHLFESLTGPLLQIDFTALVMNGMLAFLLFAGALHVDVVKLRTRAAPVIALACLGTIISTFVVGLLIWWISGLVGASITLSWALVFGALISPTDPVAVLATLKSVALPPSLEVEIQGESLFNDGVGIVLFTILLRFAMDSSDDTTAADVAKLLIVEAGGGLVLGLLTGYAAYLAMRLIDEYSIEIMISLALVTTTYALAQKLHISGPLAVVAAGLLIGHRGPKDAMSEETQRHLFGLWTLLDNILNSVLFFLIGLEVLVLRFDQNTLVIALLAIPVALLSRLLAVSIPPILFVRIGIMSFRNVPLLTWAGIRGGISIALALSMPESAAKPALLACTYAVVLFSIIGQGLTLPIIAKKTLKASAE